MSDPMEEITASFFIECEELLEALQDGLQAIDDGVSDDETVNMVFRSVCAKDSSQRLTDHYSADTPP